MAERAGSRGFGRTVAVGLLGAVLTAVSASRDWATASGSGAPRSGAITRPTVAALPSM